MVLLAFRWEAQEQDPQPAPISELGQPRCPAWSEATGGAGGGQGCGSDSPGPGSPQQLRRRVLGGSQGPVSRPLPWGHKAFFVPLAVPCKSSHANMCAHAPSSHAQGTVSLPLQVCPAHENTHTHLSHTHTRTYAPACTHVHTYSRLHSSFTRRDRGSLLRQAISPETFLSSLGSRKLPPVPTHFHPLSPASPSKPLRNYQISPRSSPLHFTSGETEAWRGWRT